MTAEKLSKLTRDIFRYTYWNYARGTCRLDRKGMAIIYENRYNFYKEHNLCGHWKANCIVNLYAPRYGHKWDDSFLFELDHIEAYRANFNTSIVLVCSNYNAAPDPYFEMKEVAPLYIPNVKSYAVHFPSVEHAKAIIKAYAYILDLRQNNLAGNQAN
jgi:hypothetical protein